MSVSGLILTVSLSLFITELVELTLALLLGVRNMDGLLSVFLANLMTNPAVVLTYVAVRFYVGSVPAESLLLPLEIAAVIAEALLYLMRKKNLLLDELPIFDASGLSGITQKPFLMALVFSVILNAASYFSGVLVSMI